MVGTVRGFWVNGLMDIVGQPHLLNLLQVCSLHCVFLFSVLCFLHHHDCRRQCAISQMY